MIREVFDKDVFDSIRAFVGDGDLKADLPEVRIIKGLFLGDPNLWSFVWVDGYGTGF